MLRLRLIAASNDFLFMRVPRHVRGSLCHR
jgi:hypothetical protein